MKESTYAKSLLLGDLINSLMKKIDEISDDYDEQTALRVIVVNFINHQICKPLTKEGKAKFFVQLARFEAEE